MLQLHVEHQEARVEVLLLGVLPRARVRLVAELVVVDPHLPELACPVVDVLVGDHHRLLVDVDDALPVRVLRELRDALDRVDRALLPRVAEHEVGRSRAALDRVVLAVQDAEHLALAEEAPLHPRDMAAVAPERVRIGVGAEERVRALGGREAAHPAQRRQVEEAHVLLAGIDEAVGDEADALQVEGSEHRTHELLEAKT